jgi:hypothetical protein
MEASGLFFVHVLDQLAPHRGDGALHVAPRHQHRKITDEDLPLLLEMDVEERSLYAPPR